MLQHLSGGQWGMVGRRVFEAASRTLPLVALFFIPILFAMPTLFMWARPEVVAGDQILQDEGAVPERARSSWSARPSTSRSGCCARCLLNQLVGGAGPRRGLDSMPAGMVRFRTLSAPALLFLVLTITFAMTDWVMSLDPHWFSTIFGLMFVAGFGLSALRADDRGPLDRSVRSGALAGRLNPRHFHDLGKLLLAFTMLWAYLNFSQFLIIWSGNLPEEIPWYIERMHGGWGVVAIALVVGHFALPFMLLLSQDLKKGKWLPRVAIFILVMRLVDTIWLVAPDLRAPRLPDPLDGRRDPGGAGRDLAVPVHAAPPEPRADAAQRSVPEGGVRA